MKEIYYSIKNTFYKIRKFLRSIKDFFKNIKTRYTNSSIARRTVYGLLSAVGEFILWMQFWDWDTMFTSVGIWAGLIVGLIVFFGTKKSVDKKIYDNLVKQSRSELSLARFHANMLNHSTLVIELIMCYDNLQASLNKLIDYHENKNVPLSPPPRDDLDDIISRKPEIIREFVNRNVANITERSEKLRRLDSLANDQKLIDFSDGEIKRIIKEEKDKYISVCNTDDELSKVDVMEGHAFEYWCADLLLKNGFESAEVTKGSGDQGIDIVAVKDEVRYAIQCKCYHSDLGNSPVQEACAGKEFYGCQVAVVMTNRHLTKGARELAEKTRVLIWDRDKLKQMLNNIN